MVYKKAVSLAFVSGILFLLTSWYSAPDLWEKITDWASEEYPDYENYFKIFLVVIFFLASLGGIAVILGGIFISKERLSLGKFVIAIGAGVGLISVILAYIMITGDEGIVDGTEYFLEEFYWLEWLAIILAIVARMYAKEEHK